MNSEKTDPDTTGMLTLVATPIGNRGDISLRAIETLKEAEIILCEDTRHTRPLIVAHGVNPKKLKRYDDHSDDRKRNEILSRLREGAQIALVSDAGLPLISDPGYKLVRDCRKKGLSITAVPGANAALTALQLSGLPSDSFSFGGFLPNKSTARQKALKAWAESPGTLIFYEAKQRIAASLHDAAEILGNRAAAVCRELTKQYEEVVTGSLPELAAYYRENGEVKGEFVLVIAPPEKKELSEEDLETFLREKLAEGLRHKDAAAAAAAELGEPKTKAYNLAIQVKKEQE